MAIVSSEYRLGPVQPNGEVRVIGTATDDSGNVYDIRYRANAEDDHAFDFPLKVTELETKLPENEKNRFERFIEEGGLPSGFTPVHNTLAQLLRRTLKVFMRMKDLERAVALASWLNANVTPAQVEAATNAEIRAKVISRVTRLLAMEADINADVSDRLDIR